MRKAIVFTFAAFALLGLALTPMNLQAGEGCASKTGKTAETKMIGDKSGCGSTADKASATMAGCPAGTKEACLTKLAMSPEDCKKVCGEGQYTMVAMNVSGMTCGSCENAIKTTLADVPGVVYVGTVSHKDGSAYMLIDPTKCKNESLVKAVSDKGYGAEIIPAVATDATTAQTSAASTVEAGKAGCTAAQKAACAATGKTCGGAKKTDAKKASDKTDGSY